MLCEGDLARRQIKKIMETKFCCGPKVDYVAFEKLHSSIAQSISFYPSEQLLKILNFNEKKVVSHQS